MKYSKNSDYTLTTSELFFALVNARGIKADMLWKMKHQLGKWGPLNGSATQKDLGLFLMKRVVPIFLFTTAQS